MASRRAIVISSITALVVVFGWIGVLVAVQVWSDDDGGEYRVEAERVLLGLNDLDNAARIYAQASPRFRELVMRERFEEMAEEMQATLGPFVEIESTRTTETLDKPGGKTGRIDGKFRFRKGTTEGSLSFHFLEGRWRLLGISIDLPRDVSLATPTGEALKARIEAPPEVIAQAKELLGRAHGGEAGAVWEASAEPFRASIDRDKFIALLDNRNRAMGGFVRVLDIIKSRQHPNKNKATVLAALEYGEARTTGTFDFVKVDAAWQLSGFKIVVPEVLLPSLSGDLLPEEVGSEPKAPLLD